jgi:hypothetical protein
VRAPSHLRRLLPVLATAAGLLACTTTETTAEPVTGTSAEDSRRTVASPTEESGVTPIRLTVAGQQLRAQLIGNPTAEDLARQLPLTLTFRDLNGVEKIAALPRALTMEGVPEGDDPAVADIGYYAPSNDLVLYYGDVGYWNGIVRIGRLDPANLELIAGQADGFEVTIDHG